jgi:hypothetical protein
MEVIDLKYEGAVDYIILYYIILYYIILSLFSSGAFVNSGG